MRHDNKDPVDYFNSVVETAGRLYQTLINFVQRSHGNWI